MATSKQEQLYNEIVEYYSYADRLIRAIEDSDHKLASQQFAIIEEVVVRLEECADQLPRNILNLSVMVNQKKLPKRLERL